MMLIPIYGCMTNMTTTTKMKNYEGRLTLPINVEM